MFPRKTVEEFEEIVGSYPKPELISQKKAYCKKMTQKGTHKKFAANALQTMVNISEQ